MKKLVLLFLIYSNSLAVYCQRTIVAIGDSNGANAAGWVNQLKALRSEDSIFNYSISGNTIGFDNLGNEKLNTLKNIDHYLSDAISRSTENKIDDIIILLGTNDCKKVFEGKGEEAKENLKKLINIIKLDYINSENTHLYIVSPPPIGPDSILLEKYHGGDERVRNLLPGFLEISLKNGCHFVDIYNDLKPTFSEYHIDGIHLNENGSQLVARRISSFLDKTAKIRWDDTNEYSWPDVIREVEIISPLDSAIQKAYFYPSSGMEAKPLIVSLHTWSGDYTQFDPLASHILDKDWNYIHPDFRGVNNTPKAMGSAFAINDIDQAIGFALKAVKIPPSAIHVIGASGGGYATLYTFMNSRYDIATFSAWVPISDIEAWYYQSMGRKNKYADHILMATESEDSILNVVEARKRSPLFMDTPIEKRTDSRLTIYAGIHDGYDGSVPISQSINFYNKLIKDFGASDDQLISKDEIIDLISMRASPQPTARKIGERKIIFQRAFKNIELVLFEGDHEMLSAVALELLSDEK